MCVRRESFTHVQVPTEATRIGFSWSRSYRKGELPSLGVRTPPSQTLCKLHGQAVCAACFVWFLEVQRHTAGSNCCPIPAEGASGPIWWHIDFRVQIRYVLEEREAVLCWDSLFLQQPALARSNS